MAPRALYVVLTLAMAVDVWANPSMNKERTLCRVGERTYFSCPNRAGKGVISLCGGEQAPDLRYLQFRTSVPGIRVFVYPQQAAGSLEKFQISQEQGGYGTTEGGFYYSEAAFAVDSKTYLITSGQIGQGRVHQLAVFPGDPWSTQPELTIECDASRVVNNMAEIVNQASGQILPAH
jgi:hypothetical protein